jgi:helix-turn-helix protein
MVCYLKDQIHHVKLTSQETQKLALIASKQFADQKELGTLTSNSDAHYKARGFLRSQERNLGELQFLHQNNREKSIQDSPTLTKAEQNLHTIIGQINTEYRSAYESQQLQQMQERQIRLMRDRGVER